MDFATIFQWIGYIYVGLQALKGVLMAVKGVLSLIPGDQGEALIDKLSGYIDLIEGFLGKLIPTATLKK